MLIFKGLKLLGLALALAGCQTNSSVIETLGRASFCDVAEPIYYSKNDTDETKKQVREHNAVGVAICGWGAK